jgi:hypothetical protein
MMLHKLLNYFLENCETTWHATNYCFRLLYQVLELFLEDLVGKTWNKAAILHNVSSTN